MALLLKSLRVRGTFDKGSDSVTYASLGWEFSGILLTGVGVGWLLDRWWDTFPWILMISLTLSMIGGFIRLMVMIKVRCDSMKRRHP